LKNKGSRRGDMEFILENSRGVVGIYNRKTMDFVLI
jgi:hypothetical protein